MVLPIRSFATGTSVNGGVAVHTLNLSSTGAKLGAFRHNVKRGDVLTMQRQHKRAKCKVVWTREVGPQEIQVGIEFLQAEEGFWGVPLEESRNGICVVTSEL